MTKEGAYAESEFSESIEAEPTFSKEAIKGFIEGRRSITDSGANGILFRIDPEELSPEDQKRMAFENTDNPEGALSIKALKVFNLEKAKQEFESLKKAREIMLEASESSSAPLFRIPRAIGFEEIQVDKETEEFLNSQKASVTDGRVGVITMDWIEGQNLGVYLHEELIKRTPDREDPYEAGSWDNRDFGKLLHALEKTGYVLPDTVLDQIKNGVQALHKGRLWHNDLHFGNLIIRPDGKIYAIDFADATRKEIKIEESTGPYHLSDENIVRSLEPLAKTPEMKREEQDKKTQAEWNDRIATLEKHVPAEAQYKLIEKALEGGNTNILENVFIGASGFDRDLDNYLGNLLRLSRKSDAYREQIGKFLDERLNDKKSKMRSFVINRIQTLQRVIEI